MNPSKAIFSPGNQTKRTNKLNFSPCEKALYFLSGNWCLEL